MIINVEYAELTFKIVYFVSFVFVLTAYLRGGIKAGTSLTSLWLIFVTGMIFFRSGIYLFPMSSHELKDFILNGNIVSQGEKSILGGVLGIGGFVIAISWLKEKASIVDSIAIPLILAFGLQNIGCLMAGCCHGIETTLFWGITYPGHAHSVHPVQLILMLACFIIAVVLYKMRDRFKAPLSFLLFGLSLFFLAKMFSEFLRDPITDHSLGYKILGLKAIQWVQITLSLSLGLTCLLREKYYKRVLLLPMQQPSLWRYTTLLMMILVIGWKIRPLIDYTVAIVLFLVIVIAIFLVAWQVFKSYTLPQYRIATIAILMFSVFFMGQTYVPRENEKYSYNQWGGSLQFGSFFKTVGVAENSTDCDGNATLSTSNPEIVKYQNKGAGLYYAKVINISQFKSNTIGINAFGGYSHGKSTSGSLDLSQPFGAIQPYAGTKTRFAGITAGATLGYFHFNNLDNNSRNSEVGDLIGNPRNLYFQPSFSFFLGPYDIIYLKAAYSFNHLSPIPGLSAFFAIGSGFGKTDGRFFEFGRGTSGYTGQFSFPVNQNTLINFSGNFENNSPYFEDHKYFFGLGFSHRFNYKNKKEIINTAPESDQAYPVEIK